MVCAGTYHCELTWHQEELMAFNFGLMTVYISLQEKLYLPTILKSLREVLREERIRLRFQTFAEVVVNNKSLLIQF